MGSERKGGGELARVLLIADDLTGALDAGACLLPASVLVATSAAEVNCDLLGSGPAALSVNAGTRHVDAASAAERVAALVSLAREAGVGCIVKKTDSALRGNVGAELAAAWRASGCRRLHFIPALPEMGRVTRGGVHYVDGLPVSASSFGRDPFEPVTCSNVIELVRAQTDVPVTGVAEGAHVPRDARGIVVYDATTADSMLARARELASLGELGVVAGCSSLARALAQVLDLEGGAERATEGGAGNLLVVCGSVNAASRAQCAHAAASGAPVLRIAKTEKTSDAWLDGAGGEAFCARVGKLWTSAPLTVIDGSGLEDLTGLVPEGADVRQMVADHIGAILVRVCERGVSGRVLVTGGDILSSFLSQAGVGRVRPLGQFATGIVGFELALRSGRLVIFSKSGGFGNPELFVNMAGRPRESEKECAQC